MNLNYLLAGLLASPGLVGLATDVNLNVDAFSNAPVSVQFGIAAIAVIGCMLGLFTSHLFKQNALLGLFALVACVACAAFSLAVSIERISTSKGQRVHAEVEHNTRYERLVDRIKQLKNKRAEERLTGIGPNWRMLDGKIDKAEAELAVLGAPVPIDQGSANIARYLPGVSAEDVSQSIPVLGGLALALAYNVCLIGAGFVGGSRPRTITVTPHRPRKQLTRHQQVEMYMLDFARRNDGAIATFADVRDGLNLPDATALHYRQKVLRQS